MDQHQPFYGRLVLPVTGLLLLAIAGLVYLNRSKATFQSADNTAPHPEPTAVHKTETVGPAPSEGQILPTRRGSSQTAGADESVAPIKGLLERFQIASSSGSIAIAVDAIRDVHRQEQDKADTVAELTRALQQTREGDNLDSIDQRAKQQEFLKRIDEVEQLLGQAVDDARKAAKERLMIQLRVQDDAFFEQLFAIPLPVEEAQPKL